MTNEETLTTHSLSVHTKHNTRWLTICGLLMAINVGLSSFGLPVPGGHLYLNDIVIVAAALMLDPLGAFLDKKIIGVRHGDKADALSLCGLPLRRKLGSVAIDAIRDGITNGKIKGHVGGHEEDPFVK